VRYQLQIALLLIAVLYAWRKGGTDERLGAAVMVSMFAATDAYRALIAGPGRYESADFGFFAIDAAILLALLGLSLFSNRWWTLWMAAAQLIALLAHVVRLVDSTYAPFAYAVMMRAPSWLELVILICGTALLNTERPSRDLQESSPKM
jgi:hypothetical protein